MRGMRTRIVLALVACAALAALTGCTGEARGVLVSLTGERPIAGATIQVGSQVATTDPSGRFSLQAVPVGANVATVTVQGFPPFQANLNVEGQSASEATITLKDSALKAAVVELAIEPTAIPSCTVFVGEATATVGPDGRFEVVGLPPGPIVVRVAAPSHEPTETTITLLPSSNEASIDLSLTPEQTYLRYFEAYKFGRIVLAYKYVHPDIRKKQSLRVFTKDMQSTTAVSLVFGKTRTLAKWKSSLSKKSYSNVAEIDRTYTGEYLGTRFTDNASQHWVKVAGIWFLIFAK